MFKKLLLSLMFSFHFFVTAQESAKLNDHEPIHILAAIKFPIDQISPQDTFTQEIFKDIDATFGSKGINLDAYQIEHMKKAYLYLIFLTKLEKVKNNEELTQQKTSFTPFLHDNLQPLPLIPTAELLNSNDWLQVKIDREDIINSTMWQLFCKSMITDINAYLIIGLKLIHNCEKQEFNYIPHFETSYYNQDYVQIRNINAVVRIKIELEQQIQERYLNSCNDWKKFLNPKTKSITKLETQIILFQKTDFYQKTHNMHNLMDTQNKFAAHKPITHEDLLSAPAILSPLKEYVFGFFLLYELYGQITSFMDEENLDQVLTIGSSSNLSPNIFPYTQDDYILISELLSGKNVIQDKPTNSIHPNIKTFKPEDLRNVKDWINPTRRPTDQYLKQQVTAQKSVQAQSFFGNLFGDIGHDIATAFSDVKHGVEKAADAVKDFGESVAYGVAGFTLTIGGDTGEGSSLMGESSQKFKRATHDLESSIDDFGTAIKEGVIAPVGELTGDIVSFITDDKKIGADINTVITNCADALVNIAEQALNTAAVGLIYVYTLPEQIISALIETMVAAVVSIWNQQAALDICHSILRSLVSTFMMVAQVAKENFLVIMNALGTFMNSITTLFNDLIREITFIVIAAGTTFADIAGADINVSNTANKIADTVYNTINQHRAIINQVIGVAVMIGGDLLSGGTATAADIAIDAELEASLTQTAEEAENEVANAKEEVDKAEQAYKDATNQTDKEAAKTRLKQAEKNLKKVKEESDTIINNVNKTRSEAQDAARDARDERQATTVLKKAKLKVQRFFRGIGKTYKNLIGKSIDSVKGSLGRSWKFLKVPFNEERITAYQEILAQPSESVLAGLNKASDTAAKLVTRVKNIPDEISSMLEDGKNFLTKDTIATTEKATRALTSRLNDLQKAQEEFDQALQDYKASIKNPEEFTVQQQKLLNATKKLRQAELEFENANQDLAKNLQKLTDQGKNLEKDPLKEMKQDAQNDINAAKKDLSDAQAGNNPEEIAAAQQRLSTAEQRLKNIENAISKLKEPDSVPEETASTPLKEQISEKLDDALEYIQSKGKSFKNLFKSNTQIAEQAAEEFEKANTELTELNTTLEQQEARLKELEKETPLNEDEIAKAKKERDDTKNKIKKKEAEVKNAREYARDARTKADESAKSTAMRYLKNAFSPIGMFMNIAFNFTSIVGGYNQDQKNLLQQKEQEEAIQNLWKSNTESKISTAHMDIASLDEITEKQKASIGNQILGLSLSQNYSYANLEQFIQTVKQTVAMIYSLELHQDPNTGLIPANIGTLWGFVSNYLNLYPSEGFYTTTAGRPEFPYSQEVAQAPHLLTQNSTTKTKQWFNQRCTAIDSIHKNGTPKKPNEPLTVAIDLKFLYTLESEFYVGIYLGGNYYDYFKRSYLASLLGTTEDKLPQAYAQLEQAKGQYNFNLNLININETYMAKMVVLYRKSGNDQLNLGIYEQNLTNKEWILTQVLPENMQFNLHHTYNLQAKLDQGTVQVIVSVDNDPQTTINKTVSVTPLQNQRMYGIIASSAAIEWNQTTPILTPRIATNVRKSQPLTLETERNKQNKLIMQEALNQTFGGQELTLISKSRARIFGQYIYASVQTDIAKISPKNPADLLIFATNSNGTITDLGKAPNSFKDSATNVLVSLITGHVFDSSWNCISTVPNAWQTYNASDYGPFLPTLQETIQKQQQLVFSKLELIKFGPFNLNAINLTALENGIYLYSCEQTLVDASGKPFTDYVVFAPDITTTEPNITLGLTPTAKKATAMVSLITGNVYDKNTTLIPNKLPVPITTINSLDISTYLKQNLSAYSGTIFAQTQQYSVSQEQKEQNGLHKNIAQAVNSASTGPNKNWFTSGKTFHFTFKHSPLNFADRQRQAAAGYKMQYNTASKVILK